MPTIQVRTINSNHLTRSSPSSTSPKSSKNGEGTSYTL